MSEQPHRETPWLDRLALRIPGYGGYHERGQRRAADRALRDAVASRLRDARSHLEDAILRVVDRGEAEGTGSRPMLGEVGDLERVRRHLDRVAERIRSAGSGTDAFYGADRLDPAKADVLHAFDLGLFDRAEALARRFDRPGVEPGLVADVESDLRELESKLDERATIMRGI